MTLLNSSREERRRKILIKKRHLRKAKKEKKESDHLSLNIFIYAPPFLLSNIFIIVCLNLFIIIDK